MVERLVQEVALIRFEKSTWSQRCDGTKRDNGVVMKTLGLHFSGTTSSAAFVNGGQLIAAAAEERFSREKYTRAFPKLCCRVLLEKPEFELD